MYMKKEFKNSELTAPGTSGLKPISWTGIRYMITEVQYICHQTVWVTTNVK